MGAIRVTDHALLRYLDRVERIGVEGLRQRFNERMPDYELLKLVERELHMDLEPVRNELARVLMAAGAPATGKFIVGNITAVLDEGKVKTILTPTSSAFHRHEQRRERRRIKSDRRNLNRSIKRNRRPGYGSDE